jgi:gliding motility associated protien GldN
MKNIVIFKYVLTALVIFFITNSIFAQRKSPRSAYDTKPASAYDKKAPAANNTKSAPAKKTSTAKKGEVVTNTDSASSSYNNKLPIELVVDEGADDGLYGATKPSLRKDNILEDGDNDSTATPLPYTALYSSDALFRVRVWRTIDTRTQKNSVYFYNKDIEGGNNTRLINLMLKAIKDDGVQAFSNVDDRFTTSISFDDALSGFGGGKDTSAKYDLEGNIVGYQVRAKSVSADSVYKFRIKEEWLFNKRDGKTYVRILGIAPLFKYVTSDGYVMDNSEHAVFWIYYPDLRKTLVRNRINNPLKLGGSLTWEEVFENRLFESTIIKSSLDAENGYNNSPLTQEQAGVIEKQLGRLSDRLWNNSN